VLVSESRRSASGRLTSADALIQWESCRFCARSTLAAAVIAGEQTRPPEPRSANAARKRAGRDQRCQIDPTDHPRGTGMLRRGFR
jgi:hypothetical protein